MPSAPPIYHQRFLAFLKRAQKANIVIGGAMTDPKGDRSKPPHKQSDPDLFLRVVKRDDKGIYCLRRQDAPDRRGQFALADLHADHAHDRGRQGLVGGRRGARRCARADLRGRAADQRHPRGRRRHARCRQRAVRRPGSDDRVRQRVRAVRSRVHGRRVAICRDAGRALHHLSPLILRVQNRPGRRADRRRGGSGLAQRRRGASRISRTSWWR